MNFLENTEGNAIVYCEGGFETPFGKTAHGLVRFTRRYNITAVVDSTCMGRDSGAILDREPNGIPVAGSITEALEISKQKNAPATHMVMGLAPDGGVLTPQYRQDFSKAISMGLNIDSGLHYFLCDDKEFCAAARQHGVTLRDIRKPPPREHLHFFSGKIEEVESLKIAVLGTDSAIGKRTTAWLLVKGLIDAGYSAEMIGTGQTAWLQGAKYSMILDSLVNDFVSGEIEHAVWSAWNDNRPKVIVLEGQGSLMNPAFPGGFELLAAGRPDILILQHAPTRKEYDGFPGYHIEPLATQIQVAEMVSKHPVAAVTLNHENLKNEEIPVICRTIEQSVGVPVFDVLLDGASGLVAALLPWLEEA